VSTLLCVKGMIERCSCMTEQNAQACCPSAVGRTMMKRVYCVRICMHSRSHRPTYTHMHTRAHLPVCAYVRVCMCAPRIFLPWISSSSHKETNTPTCLGGPSTPGCRARCAWERRGGGMSTRSCSCLLWVRAISVICCYEKLSNLVVFYAQLLD